MKVLNLIGAVFGIIAIEVGIARGDEFMVFAASTCAISNAFLMFEGN